MVRWLMPFCLVLALPLAAQSASASDEKPVEPFADLEVGGVADGQYLPLALGRDRTGLGLRTRASVGWDNNIFKEDRNLDNGLFGDAVAQAWVGHNFGLVALGARGTVAGRLYFGEPDADMWDLKLGGFVKVPYGGGGWGFGISADVLYQQLQTYELTGPLTRQDDLRASGGIARVHVGYSLSFLIFELGFTGKTTDFSEENAVPSYDNWEIGSDFSVYINAWDVLEIRPYIEFSYAWFRDQFDLQDDGTLLRQEDDLQLLKFNYGADVRLDIGLIEAEARVYSLRQDDSAAGFNRYWQYGLRGALDLNLYEPLRITFGLDAWHREYDDRVDVDSLDPDSTVKTTFERYAMLWTEVAYNVYSFLYLGGRYSYSRRISDVNAAGYAVHTATLFVELNF